MPLTHSPASTLISSAFGAIFIAFGINCILNPTSALSFFELTYPFPSIPSTSPLSSQSSGPRTIIDALMLIYGVRDIFMGVAILIAAAFTSRTDKRVLGWIVAAAGATTGVDGLVCKVVVGKGEMNHWGYAPLLVGLGSAMAAAL